METLGQFLTAFGGVDGCHIPLKCRHGGNEARKEYLLSSYDGYRRCTVSIFMGYNWVTWECKRCMFILGMQAVSRYKQWGKTTRNL